MRELARLAVAVGIVFAAAALFFRSQPPAGPAPARGSPAPPLRLPALAGGEVDLASHRGRMVVVNFWATWCAPCVAEMPSLERLYRALGPARLVVLGVSVDEDGLALREFVAEHEITFPILRDPGGRLAAAAFGVGGYPSTFVIDGAGILRESYVGPAEWATPEALAHLRGLLASSSTAPTR